MNELVLDLADDLVAIYFRESPLSAFLMGLDDVSGTLGDLAPEVQTALAMQYELVAQRAQELLDSGVSQLTDSDVLTVDHIVKTARASAKRVLVPQVEFTVTNFSTAPFAGLVTILPQLPIGSAERRERYLECLRAIPRFLEQAAERHRGGVAEGLVPTERGIRYALDQLDAFLSSSDYNAVLRTSDDVRFIEAQRQILSDEVAPAARVYQAMIREVLQPHGRSDEQCGLHWLAGGDDIYSEKVRQYTWSDDAPQAIHDLGLALIERLKVEFVEIGTRLWGAIDFEGVRDRLVNDPDLRFTTGDEILETAAVAVQRAEEVAPRFFGVVPNERCSVSPIPEALAASAAVAYYYGGTLDGSRPGTYFVNTSKPTERTRHSAEAVAYHEAVPGHHFQLTIAQEFGTHLVYRVTRDVTNAEGWGLYSERLADEMGLYSDDVARLGMLTADAMRSARLVVDTGIHALGWSRQTAIDWMTSVVPMPKIEIIQETDRYIMAPGQALAYMFGRLKIEEVRRKASEHLGSSFDLRSFHDMVLATGPIALPAFVAAADRWIDRQSPVS